MVNIVNKKRMKYCGAVAVAAVLSSGSTWACNLNSAGGVSSRLELQSTGASVSKEDSSRPKKCEWEIKQIDTSNCNITRARLEGSGAKPQSTVTITRNSNDDSASMRSLTGDNSNWHWQGNNLNCSSGGCGTSSYTVKTDDPVRPLLCRQRVTLILSTN